MGTQETRIFNQWRGVDLANVLYLKKCQSNSWKVCHKYECKIYGRLYPRLLPSVVRTVMQILLRKKAKSLPEGDWQDFLNLQAHLEDIKNDSARNGRGSAKWQDVELMSQATLEYSQVIEPSDLIKLTLDEVLNLETEGMRLYSVSEKASPLEKTGLLGQAMGLFHTVKDMYPLWRYPWPTIRHAVILAQMTLEHWYEALGHALKSYFFIEPVLYPITWDPLRAMRTFLLVKIMIEIEYNKSQSQDAGSALGNLDRYDINWPVAISALMAEVQTAIPKGFGTDSGFAREFEQLQRGVGLEDGGWISFWGREREKLKKAAQEMVD
ncbi:MAG: hypothetical protein Q9188_001496 [Gyalolechia gomerana]